MRNKCNIIRDLLPLYVEDMVSEDTASFVNEHLSGCASCNAEYKKMKKSNAWETFSVKQEDKTEFKQVARDLKKKIRFFCMVPMMLGLIFGLSLTLSVGQLYNLIIMPIVGVLGYYIFRWKAILILPLIVFVSYGFLNVFNWLSGENYLPTTPFFAMVGIYCVFIAVGLLIAALLHFAFKKEKK